MRKPYKKIKDPTLAKKIRRKLKIRKTISGTSERPRICVSKTNKNLFIQVIDDVIAKTLFTVQTYGKNAATQSSCNKEAAKIVGVQVAEKLKALNLNNAVFDRGGNKYHGVLSTLADSVRENGISI